MAGVEDGAGGDDPVRVGVGGCGVNAISSGQALWKMYKCGLIPDRCTAKRQGNCFIIPSHSLLHGRLRLQRWGWRRLGCLPCLESRCCGTGDGVSPSGSGHGHAVSGRRGSALGVALGFCRGEWGAGWESCRDRAVLAGTCCPGWRLLSGRRPSSAVHGMVQSGWCRCGDGVFREIVRVTRF